MKYDSLSFIYLRNFLLYRITILLFIVVLDLFASSTSKDILLIHSYHRGYKWSDDISNVLEQKFGNRDDMTLATVYMDTKKVASSSYFTKLFELYRERFKDRSFDVVIAADNNALEFVVRYHDQLFKDIPVVFLGINNFDEATLDENNIRAFTTGVVEEVDIEKNIDLILDLHPSVENILIINDRSKTGFAMKRDIFAVLSKYKGKVNFEYVDNIEISNLQNKIFNLPKNTVILWVLLFKDKAGKYFTYKESLQKVRSIAYVPIYGLWDFYLGEGIVGGVLTSATAQASAAAQMVESILNGTPPRAINIQTKSPNQYMFDYKQLQRYKLKIPKDIKDHILINKPFSFYETYKILVWITLSIIGIFTFVSILLSINIAKRKKSESALINQLKFIEVLMDTIPNPMNYKNLDGTFAGCNKAFTKFFGKKKEDIIGKNLYALYDPDIAQQQALRDAEILQKRGTMHFKETLHLPNHQNRIVAYSKSVYENIDGSVGGIVSVMDDVTKQIEKEQFLIQQAKLAEMGEMIAAIAHQWNEPLVELSAILQDMEFSYRQKEMDTIKMKDFVNESMVQIQYMSQTLKDFRNFLKPSIKKKTFYAKAALDQVLEIVGRQIFYAHINLDVACNDEYVTIYGYENEFKQVLLNIINNAKNKIITHKNGQNIKINIQAQDDQTQIRISDDGGFIDEDIIDFIFDPYFTTNKHGTGLGLYMAKVIIEEKMNGKINVCNDLKDVVFNILVPSKGSVS